MDVIRDKGKRSRGVKPAAVVGSVVIAAAAAFATVGWSADPALPSVSGDSLLVGSVKRGEMIRQVTGPGVLVATDNRLIPSILPKAQVERVLIQAGTVVQADSVLLRMSNPLVLQQFDEARLRLEVAEAQLTALRARLSDNLLNQESQVAEVRSQYEAAKLQVQYEGKLAKDRIISRLQHEKSILTERQLSTQLEIETKRALAIPSLNEAEINAKASEIALLRRQLALQESLVGALDVKAGIDGVVQEIRVKEGQGVDQGEILAVVARQDSLKAEVRIMESQAREVVIGQKVRIDIGSSSEAGTVTRIDPSVSNGTVTVDVAFSGDTPKGARTNLRVNATIEVDRLADVLYVAKPPSAKENAQVKLFKIDSKGIATLTDVRLGRMSSSSVEVVDGLSEGSEIVLSDASEFVELGRFQIN